MNSLTERRKRPQYLKIEDVSIVSLVLFTPFLQLMGFKEALLTGALAISGLALRTLQVRSNTAVPIPFIPIFVLLIAGTSAYLYYPSIQDSALVSMDIPYDSDQYFHALTLFVAAACALWFGAILIIRPKRQIVERRQWDAKQIRSWTPVIFLGALVPPALVLYGFGFDGLIERRHYLYIPGSSGAVSLSLLALPIGVALISFVLVHKLTSPLARITSVLFMALYLVMYLATGSRGLGLLPLIFLLVALVIRRPRPVTALFIAFITIPLTLWGISFPLQIRLWGEGAGIQPVLQYLSSDDLAWKIDLGRIFGNILFGLPLAGQILQSDELPSFGFWTSVSPLPSGMTRWAELQPLVSWGPATPYNALGELADYGAVYFCGYLITIGAAFGLMDNLIARHHGVLRQLLFLAALSTATLFSTGLLQYPLRNSTRYIWYLIVIVFICSFVISILKERKTLTLTGYASPRSLQNSA